MADTSNCGSKLGHLTTKHSGNVNVIQKPVNTIRCPSCTFTCAWNSELSLHRRLNHSAAKKRCRLCEFRTSSMYVMKRHVLLYHNGDNSKYNILKGMNMESDVSKNKMRVDEKVNNGATSVEAEKEGSMIYTCDACEFKACSRFVFAQHKATHSNKKIYKCNECNYFGTKAVSYRRHVISHNYSQGTFKCSQCSYSSNLKRVIGLHENLYHKNKYKGNFPNAANVISNFSSSFSRKRKRYLRVNSINSGMSLAKKKRRIMTEKTCHNVAIKNEDENVDCLLDDDNTQDYFDKDPVTSNRSQAAANVKTESYKVKESSKSSANRSNIRFSCSTCDHISQSKMEHSMHLAMHGDQPLYKCKECDYVTPHSYGYQYHVNNHSFNGAFKCDKCSYSSNKDYIIKMHSAACHQLGNKQQFSSKSCDANKEKPVSPKKIEKPISPKRTSVVQVTASRIKKKAQSCGFAKKVLPKRAVAKLSLSSYSSMSTYGVNVKNANFGKTMTFEHQTKRREETGRPVQQNHSHSDVLQLSKNNNEDILSSAKNMSAESDINFKVNVIDSAQVLHGLSSLAFERKHTVDTSLISADASQSFSRFSCDECSFQTKSSINFNRHRHCHTVGARFQCGQCTYSSNMASKISNHQRFHPGSPPKAVVCKYDKSSKSLSAIDKSTHRQGESQTTSTPIDNYGQAKKMGYNKRSNGFFNSLNIPRTIKAITQAHDTDSCSKSSRYVFNCPFCIHKTPKKSNLKIHIKRKHFRSALSVGGLDVCVARIRRCLNFDDEKVTSLSASFNSTKDLSSSTNNWNALSHSNEIENKDETEIGAGDKKQLFCPHCNYEAVTAYRLRLHINTHLQLRLFQCPVCDHRSNWSSNILKHLRRFHPTAPKNVVILSADNESKQKVDNLSYPQYKTSEESASVQLTEKEVSSPGKVKQENAEVPKYKADSRYSLSRPFMCSKCNLRSAWRNSIQQHIRSTSRCRKAQLIVLPNTALENQNSLTAKVSQDGFSSWKPMIGRRFKPSSRTSYTSSSAISGSDALGMQPPVHGGTDDKCTKRYQCNECNYSTHMLHRIKKHARFHRTKGIHQCLFCSFSSDLSKTVTFHMRNWHSETKNSDNVIIDLANDMNQKGESNSSLILPKKDAQLNENDCNSANYTVIKIEGENSSSGTASNTSRRQSTCFYCPFCKFGAYKVTSLKNHMLKAHHKKVSENGGVTNLLQAIREKAVAELEPKDCNLATVGTPNSLAINESNSMSNDFELNISAKTGSSKSKLLTCPICGYRTENKFKMDPHIEAHSNKRRYMCATCGQRANWRVVIRGHIRICHPGKDDGVIVLTDEELKNMPQIDSNRTRMKIASAADIGCEKMDQCNEDLNASTFNADEINGDSNSLTDDNIIDESLPNNDLNRNNTQPVHRDSNGPFPLYKCSACSFTSRSRPYTRKHMRRKHRKNQCHLMIVWLNTEPAPNNCEMFSKYNGSKFTKSASSFLWRCSVCSWTSKWSNSVYSHIVFKHANDSEAKVIKVSADNMNIIGSKVAFRHGKMGMISRTQNRMSSIRMCRRLGTASSKGRHFVNGLDRYWCRECKYHSPYSHHVRRHILRVHEFNFQPVIDIMKDKQFLALISEENISGTATPSKNSRKTTGLYSPRSSATDLQNIGASEMNSMYSSASNDRQTLGSIVVRNVFNLFEGTSGLTEPANTRNVSLCKPVVKSEVIDEAYGEDGLSRDVYPTSPSQSLSTADNELRSDRGSSQGGEDCFKDNDKLLEKGKKNLHGRILRCRFCPFETYQNAERLRVHEKLHGSGQRYQCKSCTYSTSQPCNISKHLRKVHKLTNIAFGYLDRHSDKWKILHDKNSVIRTSQIEIDENCSEMENNNSESNSVNFLAEDSGDGISSELENIDDEESSVKSSVVPGRINETGSACAKVFRCRYCPFYSETSSDLKTHYQDHKISNKLRCPFCTFSSSIANDLQLHIGLHFMGIVENEDDCETEINSNKIVAELDCTAEGNTKSLVTTNNDHNDLTTTVVRVHNVTDEQCERVVALEWEKA